MTGNAKVGDDCTRMLLWGASDCNLTQRHDPFDRTAIAGRASTAFSGHFCGCYDEVILSRWRPH